MAEKIQAIETVYDGYRFRSRLEARWAVYFHEAGLPYVYEPEGFALDGHIYYLPDFYLPWFNAYVEIKPGYISEEDEKTAKDKLELLYFTKASETMIFFGDPYENEMEVFGSSDTTGWSWKKMRFLEGAWYLGYDDVERGYSKHWVNISTYINEWEIFGNVMKGDCFDNESRLISYRSDFDWAKLKARQARFEHGETPEATA